MLGFFKKKKNQEAPDSNAVDSAIKNNDTSIQEESINPDTSGNTDNTAQDSSPTLESTSIASEKPEKNSWFKKLKNGLSRSSDKISGGITGIFTKCKLDDETLEELEDLLITTDMGVKTVTEIISELAKGRLNKEITSEEIKGIISNKVQDILTDYATALEFPHTDKPNIMLVCGVNGNGKTTTIGKIAQQLHNEGKKVMLVACDTFRAAAVEQLSVWAERSSTTIIKGEHNADPASVAYKAVEKAQNENYDVVLIDTAGRLQNKTNLMQELQKIVRVVQKLDSEAPHNTLLVLDATTGQNAYSQARSFKEIAGLTGLIVTKLDGTAKGGVVVGLAREFSLPIHALGVGEGIYDLQPFNAKDFADNLVGLQ